jgi:predicted enzyme related to lactoylglutathione lyase
MSQEDHEENRKSAKGVDARLTRHGGLSYPEIPAADARGSAVFYENVLGWKIDRRGTEDFRFGDATGSLIGRWVSGRVPVREPGLLPYFYVDHIDDAVTQVTAHGGELHAGPTGCNSSMPR